MARIALLPGLTLPLLLACAPPKDRVVHVAQDDSAMNAAINQSRRTVSQFLAILEADPPKPYVAVKVRLQEGDQVEHIWMSSPRLMGGRLHGTIDNDIETLSNYHAGDTLSVLPDSISDWMYAENGIMQGGYSVRLLAKQMSAPEREGLPFQLPADSAW